MKKKTYGIDQDIGKGKAQGGGGDQRDSDPLGVEAHERRARACRVWLSWV